VVKITQLEASSGKYHAPTIYKLLIHDLIKRLLAG